MKVYGKSLHVSMVSANLLHNQPLSHPRDDIEWIKSAWNPDIIACQESEGYGSVLRNIPGYGCIRGAEGSGNATENTILFHKKTLRFVGAKSWKVTSGRAHHDPSRYVTMGHFATQTDGVSVYYFNTHINHHIDIGGHPRPGPQTTAATAHFRKMAELVETQAKAGPGAVFWGGDFNVDERADNRFDWKGFPNQIFREHHCESVFDELHHIFPGRVIDIIGGCNLDKGVKAMNVVQGPSSVHSDHRFTKAVYSIPRKHTSAAKTTVPTKVPDPIPDKWWDTNQDPEFPETVPVPQATVELDDILEQPTGTVDHSVCCKKDG